MKPPRVLPALACCLGWLLGAGCTSVPSQLPDGATHLLGLQAVGPDTLLPGSWVVCRGEGFVGPDEGSLVVSLERGGGQPWLLSPVRIDDQRLEFRMDRNLWGALGGPGTFQGTLRVQASYTDGQTASAELAVSWTLLEQLTPSLDHFSAAASQGQTVYLGSALEALGDGFLLDGEGFTELRLNGQFVPADGSGAVPIQGRAIVLEPDRRDRLAGPLPAAGLGIHPGLFNGSVRPVNVHDGGFEIEGTGLPSVSFELGPTALLRFEPTSASRGQWIDIYGRGFVAGEATTVIQIEGTFTRSRTGEVVDLSGADALQIPPEVLAGDHMRYILRVSPDGHGGLTGLGAEPGTLRGSATPVVYYGADEHTGLSLPGQLEFQVLAQKQVVYISYLPGFTDALRDFGLRNVEDRIRDRILTVANRDYQEFSVEFRALRPTDFLEYSVIEVGGVDPNGQGLIGLDATMGKDIGNLYFDDVVGGANADSRESGHYAFGGVFVSSYLAFSPHAPEPMPIASPRFDDLFGPFMERLGGTPVEASEYPGGARAAEIEQAIHALGSMIGNTLTHEIGHTLGLAAGAANYFHNDPPGPNQIMDGGGERPFEERAEIDGQGPAVWATEDHTYLQTYLPK
ncbi:MAG TPA: hypothetical protein PK668_23330 [Myxococcota bacterium]|nr:hypothetical protein [Myxococcota bacterium]HRY96518.1 hypothetical protein [Myxococcota bacterium]